MNAKPEAVLVGGPLDGMELPAVGGKVPWRRYVFSGSTVAWPCITPDMRDRPWAVGEYTQPEKPCTERGLWVLTWRGWLAPRPEGEG